MPAKLITETDPLEVRSLCVLIYGPPGVRKTSLAQSADKPLTLDFDNGIHRTAFRKAAFQFDNWPDATGRDVQAEIDKSRTLVIDTVGRMLDLMSAHIARQAKMSRSDGALSQQGWGVLKSTFAQWVGRQRTGGRDIVLIGHEKEEREGEVRFWRPDMQGSSYSEVMKIADLVGYLSIRDGKHVLNFSPTENTVGKNSAGFRPIELRDLREVPNQLGEIIAEAKARIGKTAELSAGVAKQVQPWAEFFAGNPGRPDVNERLQFLTTMMPEAKAQAWNLCRGYAEKQGWLFDKERKQFVNPKPQESAA